jgi:hypothetical protein
MIFQLPYMTFPEHGALNDMADNEDWLAGRIDEIHSRDFRLLAAIAADEQSPLGAREKQIAIDMIFGQRIHAPLLGKIPRNRAPRAAHVDRLHHVRLEIAGLMIVERRVHDIRIVL